MADMSVQRDKGALRERLKAVALEYDGERAPRVTAKGGGLVAERIVALAEAHGIPLRQDPALTELLARVELGDCIPAELYVAVAEVLAFAYSLTGKRSPEPR